MSKKQSGKKRKASDALNAKDEPKVEQKQPRQVEAQEAKKRDKKDKFK